MKWWVVGFALSISGPVLAQTNWFTLTGNPGDAVAETVQVDPNPPSSLPPSVTAATARTERILQLRVNRSQQRLNWDGIAYRSYEAQVKLDCRTNRGDYMAVRYYLQPLWQGPSHASVDYTTRPRPMFFRDMIPNPRERIVRAACRAWSS